MWEGGEEVPLIRLELNLWVIGHRCLRKLLLQAFAWDMISKWCFWECLVQSYLMDNPNSQKSTSLEKSFQTPKDPWQWFAAGSILAHHITPVEVDKMFITIKFLCFSNHFWFQDVVRKLLKPRCGNWFSKIVQGDCEQIGACLAYLAHFYSTFCWKPNEQGSVKKSKTRMPIVQAMGAVIRPISIVRHHGAKFGEIKLENWLSLHCKLSKLLLVLLRN